MEYKPSITLYYNILSQPSRAVKALLDLGSIDYVGENINPLKGETKSETFTKINPK